MEHGQTNEPTNRESCKAKQELEELRDLRLKKEVGADFGACQTEETQWKHGLGIRNTPQSLAEG